MAKPLIFTVPAVWDDEAAVWTGYCDDIPAAADAPSAQDQSSSWGGGGVVGWGRWTRAHGGARVQRDSPTAATRPAMAPS